MTVVPAITRTDDMKIALVTGHLGFIGQHLWRVLRSSDEYVPVGLDLKNGSHEDIRSCVLPRTDVCFHLAAQTNAQSTDAWDDANTNIMGTIRILEKYRNKVVFAASEAANNPVIPYAISKHACELYCRLYGARMVSMCNITGPGGHGVFEAFAQSDILRIAGDGSQRRSYAPVSHAVSAFLAMASAEPGLLYTLSGTELSVLEIAELFYPAKPKQFVEKKANDL